MCFFFTQEKFKAETEEVKSEDFDKEIVKA